MATARFPANKRKLTISGSSKKAGDIVSVDGLYGIIEGLSGGSTPGQFDVGDDAIANVNLEVEVGAPSSLVVAAGADVRVDLATQLAVASGGVVVGTCAGGKANGETTVRILLNGAA